MFKTTKVQESTAHSAYLYAIKLLAKRDYSQVKLTKKLKDRGYDQEHIESAINEVLELGYLREDNYIESRVKGFMHKGYSINFIQQKLKQEQLTVHLDFIENIFSENNETEEKQVHYLINKKIPFDKDFLDDREKLHKIKNKVLNFAISKGHDYHSAKTILEAEISLLKDS